jgi:hypothetical protein
MSTRFFLYHRKEFARIGERAAIPAANYSYVRLFFLQGGAKDRVDLSLDRRPLIVREIDGTR